MNTDAQQEATALLGSSAISLIERGAVPSLLVNRNQSNEISTFTPKGLTDKDSSYLKKIQLVGLAIFLITLHCIPANAGDGVWNGREAVYLILFKDNSTLTKPVYEDPSNIQELSGDAFGAMGEHPVKVLSINNPAYPDKIVNVNANVHNEYYSNDEELIRLKVDLYYPADINTARPTIFIIAGFRTYYSKQFYSLLYFIASHGYNGVYVSYEEFRASDTDHIKNILTQVVADPLFSQKIDTSKVGFMAHSLAGGIILHLANDLAHEPAPWGGNGRFIFTMAGWFAYLQESRPYTLPANTKLIVQTYNEELNDRPNGFDTDPRFSIDYLTSTTINNSEKTYLYLPGDNEHTSGHMTPKSKFNLHGNKHFYYDALQQVGIFRPLQSIMRYSFDNDLVNKTIGLPDTSALMRSSNNIDYYSGDNPYIDLGMKDNDYFNSSHYGFPYGDVTMASDKIFYSVGENITIHLEKMRGHEEDWVGIVRAGDNIDWEHQVAWNWTGGFINGSLTFNGNLPAGDYEAGAFFENSSTKLEAKVAFSIRN